MIWLWIAGYLGVGGVMGLIMEEREHWRSSDGYRYKRDYVFSCFACAILWPFIVYAWLNDDGRRNR